MQTAAIYAKCRGLERKTAYEVLTARVPRYEIPLTLPSRYIEAAGLLENLVSLRVDNIYKARSWNIPKKRTVCELEKLVKALQDEFKARGGGETAVNRGPNAAYNLCYKLYSKCPYIGTASVYEVEKFLIDNKKRAFDLKAGDRQFHLKKNAGRITACQGLPVSMAAEIHIAISLSHLKDLIETGCLDAAVSYSDNSRSLNSPDMHGKLKAILGYIAKDEENPKVVALAAILLEMQKEGKKCLVVCEGKDVKEALELFIKESFGDYSKMVAVTNRPTEFCARPNEAYDAAILFTPSERNIHLVWGIGVSSIFTLTARHTRDDDTYWQNAKNEDREIKRNTWDPKNVTQGSFVFPV